MRGVLRWLALVALVACALAVAFGAYSLAQKAWSGVVDYQSPYVRLDPPPAARSQAASPRVVLVIIDGLRLDASQRMSTMEALRGYGTDLSLKTSQPSLSYPNWTTILSGTTQDYHGVVTNWHKGAAPVETLLDTARAAGVPYVVVGPSDIATLYPAAKRAEGSYFKDWSERYLSGTYVDKTLQLVKRVDPRLVVLHLPDIDEAGHDFGGKSAKYDDMVSRVDVDLRRLVEKLQGSPTTFVVVSDHGHTDSGGHGGWEPEVVNVPCVISGTGVRSGRGTGRQEDVAPTVALLAGIGVPRYATGTVYAPALVLRRSSVLASERSRRRAVVASFARLIREPLPARFRQVDLAPSAFNRTIDSALSQARSDRLAFDRLERRTGPALWLFLGILLVGGVLAALSWRAALAALWGTLAYYGVYNALFFGLHRATWSLSAFNSEDRMDAWMNTRIAEAAIAGLVAVAVAAFIYPFLQRDPVGPRRGHVAEWLSLGPVTVLVTQLTLGLQVAWFIAGWGVVPSWSLPDLKWGFKFDLDLVQATALGAAVLLAPVVGLVIGRFHPRNRRT